MYKTRIKEKWWFSQCGRTWLVCRKTAEHLWCDFKWRPWAKNSSPNTNDLYIHYMDTSTGTPPSLEEKETLPNCGNKDRKIIHVLKHYISTSVATVLKCMKWLYPICTSHWCLGMSKKLANLLFCNCLLSLYVYIVPGFFFCFFLLHQVKQNNQKCCLGN